MFHKIGVLFFTQTMMVIPKLSEKTMVSSYIFSTLWNFQILPGEMQSWLHNKSRLRSAKVISELVDKSSMNSGVFEQIGWRILAWSRFIAKLVDKRSKTSMFFNQIVVRFLDGWNYKHILIEYLHFMNVHFTCSLTFTYNGKLVRKRQITFTCNNVYN